MEEQNSIDIKKIKHISIFALILLIPFSINHFIDGRTVLGTLSVVFKFFFLLNLVHIWRYGQYSKNIVSFCIPAFLVVYLLTALEYQGLYGAVWFYPGIVLLYLLSLPRRVTLLINLFILLGVFFIALDEEIIPLELFTKLMATLVGLSILSIILTQYFEDREKELKTLSSTDTLTGLLNRRTLDEVLSNSIEQHRRSKAPMVIATLDLDRFKKVNDEKGHDVGDIVLQKIAKLLKERCRYVDKIFRLGGEEFLILFYNTNLENAKHASEEFRLLLESSEMLPNYTVTTSIGLAELQEGESLKVWMKRSDDNLYSAKANGRNQVVS